MSIQSAGCLVCVVLLAGGRVPTQHAADYESLNGSTDGVQLNDQFVGRTGPAIAPLARSTAVAGTITRRSNLEIKPGVGACCQPDGSCIDGVPPDQCSEVGVRFVLDTLCEELDPPCIEQIGACCIAGIDCTRDPAWQCDGDTDGDGQVNPVDSGLVQAAFGATDEQSLCSYDVDCDGQINPVDSGLVQSLFGTCDAPRAECVREPRCDEITRTECSALGGDFLGYGTGCADDACGFALGACCLDPAEQICKEMDGIVCEKYGGRFLGSRTHCVDDACGYGDGACCVDLVCAGSVRFGVCYGWGGRWHGGENCHSEFRCPIWDNGIAPNGVNGRAISPPAFPNIRVVDDFVTDIVVIIEKFHANVVEDEGWTDGGTVTVTVYTDTGNGPGAIVDSVTTEYTRMATGHSFFGRAGYDYWVEGLGIHLIPGRYWIGLRNEGGGGGGTNYWMTSDGGFDGGDSDTGWFSIDGGNSWQPGGADWQHAFKMLP